MAYNHLSGSVSVATDLHLSGAVISGSYTGNGVELSNVITLYKVMLPQGEYHSSI